MAPAVCAAKGSASENVKWVFMNTGDDGGSTAAPSSWMSGAMRLRVAAESTGPKARLHTRNRTQVLPLFGYEAIQTILDISTRRRNLLAREFHLIFLHDVLHIDVLQAEHRVFLRERRPDALFLIGLQDILRVAVQL